MSTATEMPDAIETKTEVLIALYGEEMSWARHAEAQSNQVNTIVIAVAGIVFALDTGPLLLLLLGLFAIAVNLAYLRSSRYFMVVAQKIRRQMIDHDYFRDEILERAYRHMRREKMPPGHRRVTWMFWLVVNGLLVATAVVLMLKSL